MFSTLLLTFSILLSAAHGAPFDWNNDTFLLHGKPFQIIGGQMDAQRVPAELWADRLGKARAMGLNTVFSYTFWDQLEPVQGSWNFDGINDIARYFRTAQDQGLNVILRPGPYVCGEHEWGGFPAWLSNVPGMVVRTNNAPFLNATKMYFDRLAKELGPLSINNGGPILMVQIENEYGSYGNNHEYIAALRDMLRDSFGLPLYTNDGSSQSMLEGGQIPGALAETDGDVKEGFSARDKYVTNPSSLGPQLDGEYYTTWLDTWASNLTHSSNAGDTAAISRIQSDLDWALRNNGSFNIYMFHGGTNWGFQNGADWSNALDPVTTSYDYGAPLDESGRTNDIYLALRQMITSYIGSEGIPAIPENDPFTEIPDIQLHPSVAMFNALPSPISSEFPVNMEQLGQSTGLALYRHVVVAPINGNIKPGDAPRDRVLVYVNGQRVGVIDSTYEVPQTVKLALKQGDVLDLLIENMGRVNYGPRIVDQRKGIVGNVSVGKTVLSNWEIFPFPLESPPAGAVLSSPRDTSSPGPIFFTGAFDVPTVGDTFLELPRWIKGVVWVNGINLGRYWTVGPQQTLYLPGCYLKQKDNRVIVLELEPTANSTAVRGITARKWGNNPDPDMP